MTHRPDHTHNLALMKAYFPAHHQQSDPHLYHITLPMGETVSAWPITGKWRRHQKDAETHFGFQSLLEYAYPRLGPLREAVSCLRAYVDAMATFSQHGPAHPSYVQEVALVNALVKGAKDIFDTDWIGPQCLPECAHITFTGPPPPPSPSQSASFGGLSMAQVLSTSRQFRDAWLRNEINDLDSDIPF